MVRDLSELDIQFIKGVGPRKAALLKRLNINTVLEAIHYFPCRYEDRRRISRIAELRPGSLQTVMGKVAGAEVLNLGGRGGGLYGKARYGRRLSLFELSVTDGSGIVKGKWFNQPYLKDQYKTGRQVVLSGVVKATSYGLEMDSPECEKMEENEEALIHTARIVPIYRATAELSPRALRAIIFSVLKDYARDIADPMPPEVLQRLGLPALGESLMGCHFPGPDANLEDLNGWRTPWQRRLSFDELFMLEMGFAVLRNGKEAERGIAFKGEGRLLKKLVAAFPFDLTPYQQKVFKDILSDMRRPRPMNRLLQGDVGAGKTAVAMMAIATAAEDGCQSALMAPTEILAGQHYHNVKGMLEGLGLRVCLLKGGSRRRPLKEIASGDMDVVVGTHALIQEGVSFARLGLVVIDEQHRFGVEQRALLRKKALKNPDVLIMTATPIPRTLALTLYGDLDYSVIGGLPPGRTPVETRLYMEDQKKLIYAEIEREVNGGGRVYVVYPAIDENGKTNLKSAINGQKGFMRVFPGMRVELLHGRLKSAEKEAAMAGFKGGEIDILVSTTVIEVGVDVPEASLMLVVHAERFGLSQLHQLRGRVGRGRRRSRCLLLAYGPLSADARRRLEVMTRSTDGFRIAEEDLEIRGPGEFLGTRQSGLPDLRAANIVRDARLLEEARKEAFSIISKDPLLGGHPALRGSLQRFWRDRIELFNTG